MNTSKPPRVHTNQGTRITRDVTISKKVDQRNQVNTEGNNRTVNITINQFANYTHQEEVINEAFNRSVKEIKSILEKSMKKEASFVRRKLEENLEPPFQSSCSTCNLRL